MARPTATQIRARALAQITGTGMDTAIDSAIVAVDNALARYCLFPEYAAGLCSLDKDVSTAYTMYYDGPNRKDSREITLGMRPIQSITSVTQDVNGDWSYTETLVAGTDYVLDAEHGTLLWHPGSTKPFLSGRRRIKVVCVAGFDLDSDETLMQALALTIHAWLPYRAAALNITQATNGSQSQTVDKPQAIPSLVRELLQPYVLWERQQLGGL